MNIQEVVKTPGWRDIKKIFDEMVDAELKSIPTTQSSEQIAIQYIASVKVKQIIKRALNKIEKITDDTVVKPISYK